MSVERIRVGFVVFVLACGVLVATAAPFADAAVRNPIPANQLGEPTLSFTDADAVYAYFTADLTGGRICMVGVAATGCGGEPRIIGSHIGTGYTLIEAEPRLGTWKLLTTDASGNPIQASQHFTVSPCPECSRAPTEAIVQATKDAAELMWARLEKMGVEIGFLEELAGRAIGMRGFSHKVDPVGKVLELVPPFSMIPSPGIGAFVIQDPSTANIDLGLDLLKFVNYGAAAMYEGIHRDPPDPNFNEVAPPVFATMPAADTPQIQDLIQATDAQWAYGQAALHALERFQGAQIADDLDAQIDQLNALDANASALADSIDESVSRLRTWAGVAAADPELSLPAITATEKALLIPIFERVRDVGFTLDELDQFAALGYTSEEVDNIRTHFDIDITSVIPDQPYPALLRDVADAFETQADTFRDLAREAHVVAGRIVLDLPPDTPVAVNDNLNTPEDTAGTINVLANDTHPAGDTLTLLDFEVGSNGSVACDTFGNCTYTPQPDFWGNDGFTYVVEDETGDTAIGSIFVQVLRVNDPPIANPDVGNVVAGGSVLLDVLANDLAGPSDENDNLAIASIETAPSLGTAVVEDGKVRYAAPASPSSDTFQYRVCDDGFTLGVGLDPRCSVGDVTVTIAALSPPTASISASRTSSLPPANIDFDGSASADSDGSISGFEWDFGDGATDNGAVVSHRFETSGIFPVSLTVTDNDGLSDTTILNIDIEPTQQAIFFSGFNSYRAPPGIDRTYEVTVRRNNSDNPVTVVWDFGDASTPVTQTGPNGRFATNHVYTTEGDYTLVVTATDVFGTTSVSQEVIVAVTTADAGPDFTTYEGLPTTIGGPDTTDRDLKTTVDWDFGDGTFDGANTHPVHAYVDEGVYTATVTVADDSGVFSDSVDVTVVNVAPNVVASASLTAFGDPTSFRVFASDPGVDDVLTFSWDFGDGSLGSGERPSHTYAATGTYEASVTVEDGDGATVTEPLDVHVIDSFTAVTSAGQDFWLGFSKTQAGIGTTLDTPQTLLIVSELTTRGSVSIPGLLWETPFTTTPGRATAVSLPEEIMVDLFSSTAPKAVHVTADDDVTVYGLSLEQWSADAHLAYPTVSLGTEYVVATYSGAQGSNGPDETLVVATQNDTQVTFTPTTALLPRFSGDPDPPFTVSLDLGEVYQIGSRGDLTGTHVTSNKPVAVFGGNACANIPLGVASCDHIDEQLAPTRAWGKRFVSVPLATRSGGDTYRFVAATTGTDVQVDGIPMATLGLGEFHEMLIDGAAEITSSAPIQVMLYSNGWGFDGNTRSDPFMVVVPPVEQYLANYTIATPWRGYRDNYVNMAAPLGATVVVDGSPIAPGMFSPIGGSGYMTAQVPISIGDHRIESSAPIGIWVYGYDHTDSYGYIGGVGQAPVASVATVSLGPADQTTVVGDEACVEALVEDDAGTPLGGVRVDFSASGVNGATDFVFASAAGLAEFCYTGANPGEDTVEAAVGDFTATATVLWEPAANTPPVAEDDLFDGVEDTPLVVDAPGVLGNDSDDDGDSLVVESNTDPTNGTVTVNPDGSFTYTPTPDTCGLDSFTYIATDGTDPSNQATVEIDVECVNDPPVADDDFYNGVEDTVLVVDAPGVLDNDSDVEGDPLTVASHTQPANGAVTVNPDGSFTYTPTPDTCGLDSFTYIATDGADPSNQATVEIDVECTANTPPVAEDDLFDGVEDTPLVVDAPGVLGNDSDDDGDSLVVESNTDPTNGTVTVNPDGSFTYTPTPDTCGLDSFTYIATDGTDPSNQATVEIDVECVNDPPVADDDFYNGVEDTVLVVDAPGVLDNDSDVEGDPLTVASHTQPANGAVTVNPDGSFTYTPTPDTCGLDSFTYIATDGADPSNQATVEIDVECTNQPPVADAGGPYAVNEGESVALDGSGSSDPNDTIVLYEWDLDNDGDFDDATGVSTDYTFLDDGTHTVALRVTDGFGETDTGTADVQVYNVAPTVSISLSSQALQYSDAMIPVTVTASDVAGDDLTLTTEWNADGGSFALGLPEDLAATPADCTTSEETVTCSWTLSGPVDVPQALYVVRAAVGDGTTTSTADTQLDITAEEAGVYFGDNPVAVEVGEAGGTSDSFSLTIDVTEFEPDKPIARAAPGDIGRAAVSVALEPVGPGSTASADSCIESVVGVGYDGVKSITCTFQDVAVNVYTASVHVAGGYYTGAGEDIVVVYDPSLGFTTGGGWFYWPGTEDKTNFGYTMKYNKKGKKVHGSFMLIRHLDGGTKYRVKSNALYGLSIGSNPAESTGWASFSGKATYLEPGWLEPVGNHEFIVYVEDLGTPGAEIDRMWLEVRKNSRILDAMSMVRSAADNAETLGGGNIVVPH